MSVYSKVLDFIRNPDPASFEFLALEVFRHQFAAVACYRDYCLGLGVRAESVHSLGDVPAVSTLAFKHAKLVDANAADSPSALGFVTSGTTNGRDQRGRHFVPHPEIYRASAIAHLERMLFPDGRRTWMLALHPTANRMPESSLARMITWCIEHFGGGRALCVADRSGVDLERAISFLREAQAKHEAICLLGTTASFGALFGSLRGQGIAIRLPYGSRLMDTGGAKGQVAPLDAEAVVSEARILLGIDPSLVINEYGMTEMCSQLYDATAFNSRASAPLGERFKLAPPWLHATVVDPVTLKALDDGAIGLLSFFDLANAGSVSALLTEDLAKIRNGAVQVLGRAATAEARGCAMGIESFAALSDASPGRAAARLE